MKVFPKKSESVSETKIIVFKTRSFSFINHLQSKSVFETKVKLFSKRKCFLCINHLRSESVFESKVNCF